MNIATLVEEGFEEMQEDVNNPQFWSMKEVRRYVFEGLREVFKRTEINLTTRAMPLYAHVKEYDETGAPVFETFSGYFAPPVRQIQKIKEIFWVGDKVDGQDPKVYQLQVKSPAEMDQIDPNWDTSTVKSDYPIYAIQCSGDYNVMNMQSSPFRNRIKIKLYPTPNDINAELQTALQSIQGMEQNLDGFNLSAWSDFYGGLASSEAGGIVWGLDEDDDGIPDNGVVSESTATGIMVDILAGTFDISQYGNYPKIRYIPDFTRDVFYAYDATMEDLDDMLPYDLQIALRNYMCYRCFDKESEANDKDRASKFYDKYSEAVLEYVTENHLEDNVRSKFDSNFDFGVHNNVIPGSKRSVNYNTLNL